MGKASRKKIVAELAPPVADLPAPINPQTPARKGVVAAVLFVLTCALFAPALTHDFINFDDPDYVTANPNVQRGLSAEGVRYAFTALQPYYWQPLTWLSLQLDCTLFGPSARGHLAVNVVLHALAVALLFLLLTRTGNRLWPSLTVAALWAVHPLRVESVAWVAERKDVLSTLLFIATIYVYVRFTERRNAARYLALIAVFALALMSKPMVVMLPIVLVLIDIWPLGLKPTIKDKVPLLLLAIAIVAVTFVGQTRAIAGTLPLSLRLSNVAVNYGAYLVKMVAPFDLAVIYPYRFETDALKVVGSLALLAAITAGVYILRARRALVTGWGWYLVTLAPVAGFVQAGAQSMADRFTYIPSIGILIGLVFGFAWRKPALVAAGIVAVTFSLMTSVYLRAWRDSVTLFTHAIAVTGPNAFAHVKLGDALMDLGRFPEADAAYGEAVRISNGGALPLASAGGALVRQKRYAEAIAPLRRAFELDPNASVRENLGTALMHSGQAPEAITHFETALNLDGGSRRAEILQGLGDAKRIAGRLDDGIADLRSSIALKPTAEAWSDLGSAYATKNDLASAEDAFKHAIRLNPDFYDARMNYSAILNRANRNDEATQQIREAMRIDPKSIEPRVYLALVMAASGKNAEAAAAAIEARDIDARTSNEILSKALQLSPAENNLDAFIAKMQAAPQAP